MDCCRGRCRGRIRPAAPRTVAPRYTVSDSKPDSRRQIGFGPPKRQFRLISTMRRKIGDDKARAGGSEEFDPAINEISVALARDAARREHRFAAQSGSEEGAKPTRKRFWWNRPRES